ncbi:hypothetical protein LEMLEM_LOCUS19703 [Lemmus lemmus]
MTSGFPMKHAVFSLPSGIWDGNFASVAELAEKAQTPALTCQTTASPLENTRASLLSLWLQERLHMPCEMTTT